MLHLASSIPPETSAVLDRGPEAAKTERSGYSGRYVLWVQSSEGFANQSSALIGSLAQRLVLWRSSVSPPLRIAAFKILIVGQKTSREVG